jgi:NADPH:quinone reductase-like Zn-dependent oxidoreductase
MKALQFKRFGEPDVLEYGELPSPTCDAGSAIVRVVSASVNPSDVKNVAGHFQQTVLPRTPGRDFSGRVVDGPAGWIGAEVWGTGGDIGFTLDGTHAELLAVPIAALAHKPSTLSHDQASAVGVTFVVAWLGTVDYARLADGETVAVLGVGGGVGGAVTQIAKSRGCRVIGIDVRPPAKDSPAARLIDSFVLFDGSTSERVRTLTGGAGVDLVFDSVGGVAFETALSLARRRGRVVEISATRKRRVELDLIDFYHNETQLIGVDSAKLGVAEAAPLMRRLNEGFESGAFTAPAIVQTFDLQHARQAYEAVAAGARGRVVIHT